MDATTRRLSSTALLAAVIIGFVMAAIAPASAGQTAEHDRSARVIAARPPKVRVPPPPQGWKAGPSSRSGRIGRLSVPVPGAAECVTTFDEDEAIDLFPDDAHSTFAPAPWWNQQCSGDWVRMFLSAGSDHFHLAYTDPNITVCLNPDNEFGTPAGTLARGELDCEPIDPVTEPRSHLHTMVPADVLRIERIKPAYLQEPSEMKPFTLSRIQIKSTPVNVCFRLDGAWEAAAPPPPGQIPGQFCWESLGQGTWDLSSYTSGSKYVTIEVAESAGSNFEVDNIRLDW